VREKKMNIENGENVRMTRARARAMEASSGNEKAVGLRDITNISTKSHLKRIQTSNFQVYQLKIFSFFIIIIIIIIIVAVLLLF
jgi:hypothetical protein